MPDLLTRLWSSDQFMPHGHCYLWKPEVVWLHVVSDSLIALAYLTIPVTLGYFVRHRRDLPFAWMFLAFGTFIISCGTTHVMEVVTLWKPVYWLSGSIKVITATASVSTAVLLVPLVPRALAIPSPAELRRAHEELQRSEARFRAATEGMRDAFYIVESVRSPEGNIVDFRLAEMNDSAKRWLGIPAALGVGQAYSEIVERCRHALSAASLVEVVDKKEPLEQERRIEDAGGSVRWVREQLVPLGDGLAITVRQITDERRHQEVLELHSAILRSMNEGVCVAAAADRRILYANPAFESMLGYRPGELDGQPSSIFAATNLNGPREDLSDVVRQDLAETGKSTREATNLRKDGKRILCRSTTSAIRHQEHGEVWVTVQEDVTEQRRAEKAVEESLHEKEVLLREIHHRVKNNLQVISSLLKLHALQITDPVARSVFHDSQERVRSIALLHEKLYQSPNLGRIDVRPYAETLAQTLLRTYGPAAGMPKVLVQAEGVYLPMGAALPFGLILNELVTNSLKHAFASTDAGARRIGVRIAPRGEDIELVVEDNGIGLPTDFEFDKAGTLGMRLVQILARQLGGQVTFSGGPGTRWTIRFPRGTDTEG
jgi:PAS domain S-box-containing protein